MTRSDFAGSVADHYLSYRRDVPADLAARIAAAFGWAPAMLCATSGAALDRLPRRSRHM